MTIFTKNNFGISDSLLNAVRDVCRGEDLNEGKAATRFFLTIKNNKVVVQYKGTSGGEVTRVVKDLKDFKDFLKSKASEAEVSNLKVQKSSTIDFPEEETSNSKTIKLANLLSDLNNIK